ncbi:MAG: hypothetical protein WA359_04775 [Acidimicrobiales bacterium]
MIRNIAVVLSLAIIGAGVWLLTRVHDVVNSCSNGPTGVQVGINSGCENGISFYFLGFAFAILGLIALSLALFAIKRKRRGEHTGRVMSDTNVLDEQYREKFRHDGT